MLGDKIKKLRNDKGMSQAEFAKAIGISRSYLSEIENGKKNPATATLNKIIKAFKLRKDYFEEGPELPVITQEIKIKEINRIKARVVSDMQSLKVYKKEFDSTVEVFADSVFLYNHFMQVYERLGYPVMNNEGKKPEIVSRLEALRKDIGTYSDKLMLNPKAYQTVSANNEPPKSKLADMLRSIG